MSGLPRLKNMFRVADLRNKIFFTSSSSSCSGSAPTSRCRTSTSRRSRQLQTRGRRAPGGVLGLLDMFSGGALTAVSVFFLGIMPYITASIIMQLLGVVIPKLEEWQNEGQTGQKKITQWTRYLTGRARADAVDRVRVRVEERQRRAARSVELPAAAGHRAHPELHRVQGDA